MAAKNKPAPTTENAAPEQQRPAMAPIEQHPDFQKAISAVAEKVKADVLSQLASIPRADGAPAVGTDHAFADALAMAIAGLTDQGSGRKHVAPQVIKARSLARERMTQLLIEARANGYVPTYELRNKVYLDEVLVDPIWIDPASKEQRATVIEWRSVPNDVMVPVNEVAKEIFAAYKDSIGTVDDAPVQPAILGVTAGGLTIKSGSKAVREVVAFKDRADLKESEGGLNIPHRGKPGQFVEKHILGTVASPARQTA